MAFGMNIEAVGAQIGNMSKEGLERLNTNVEALTEQLRRQNDISTVTVGLSILSDEETEQKAKSILKAMIDDLEYKYL